MTATQKETTMSLHDLMLRVITWETRLREPGEWTAAVPLLGWQGYTETVPALLGAVELVEGWCSQVTIGVDAGHEIVEFDLAPFPGRQSIGATAAGRWDKATVDELTARAAILAGVLRTARADAVSLVGQVWTGSGYATDLVFLRPRQDPTREMVDRFSTFPQVRGWWS